MLKLIMWILTIFLVVSQAFAGVSVYVDMKQTGPVDSNGEVQVRVGKNVNATYSATANYNGNPTLYHEETIQSTNWAYTVSAGSDVIYSPTQSGTGSSVTVTAKSATAGTYMITVTFSLTFTIKTPQKDAQGNYQYDSNGNQLFTTRTDGPYTGSGSATLNVKNGKFKIRLEPDDKCKETATNKRSRTRFGLGETGSIIIEPETPSDTVEFISSTATPTDICSTDSQQFTLKYNPGSATIVVKAKVNDASTPDEETYGVTAIAPTSMVAKSKRNDNEVTLVGSGMYVTIYFEPKDVSFSLSKLGEGYTKGTHDGIILEHQQNMWYADAGDVKNGSKASEEDRASFFLFPLKTTAGTLTWNISFGYYNNNYVLVPIMTNPQIATFDGQGGCVITKFGKKATRIPNNIQNLLDAIKNNTNYTDGWKYID